MFFFFFFSSRRRHTRSLCDWSSDVCSSDLMGDDTPIPPLARIPPGLYAYLRQRFAQVTNPAIDPLRETLVMTLRMHIGRRGSLLADRPAGLRLVRNEHPVLLAEEIAALRKIGRAHV